jgi:two-component system, cell cycle response regulator
MGDTLLGTHSKLASASVQTAGLGEQFTMSGSSRQISDWPLRSEKQMNSSVLIIGSTTFCDAVYPWVRHLASTVQIQVVTTATQVGLVTQTQQPQVVILQAIGNQGIDLCRKLGGRSNLSWSYCLMVDVDMLHPEGMPSEADRQRRMAIALDEGADAYLTLDARLAESGALSLEPTELRVLQSQVQAALRVMGRHQELMHTNDLLSTMALVDPLTDLSNRRALDWDLPRQVRRARDRQLPLSLMIFDLDHFKSVNDTYGHLVGDVVLKLMSARLRHNLRGNDTLFRYGGEEFVVLLRDTPPEEAIEIGRRLCRIIADQSFTISTEMDLPLTVSVGIAALDPTDDEEGLALIERADQRLRRAKTEGRNRVISE